MKSRIRQILQLAVEDITETLFPRYCLVCGSRLGHGETFWCTICSGLIPTTQFEGKHDNPLSLRFGTLGPKFKEATASVYYSPDSPYRMPIILFKYYDRPNVAEFVGQTMAYNALNHGFFDTIDAIVPIPLAPKRERWRGYNQSEMLARGIAKITGIPIITDAIIRNTFQQSQTKLDKEGRKENVKGVFEVARPELIKGKHILLVDDVITYGFTTRSCAQEALAVEGVKVSIIAYAVTKSHMHYTPLPPHIHPWD